MDLPQSRKRKRGKQTSSASSQGDLTQLAGRFGSVNVREEMEEMEETYSQLSEHAQNRILCNVPRQGDFSTIFSMDPGQFVRGLPLLRMRLEGHFIGEKMYRIRKRIDLADFYNAYMVAQNNPDAFLQRTAKEISGNGGYVVARASRKSSMVKQRFVDILFSSPFCKHESVASCTCKDAANKQKARKSANQTVEDWRRGGKPWSEIIRLFDYGILLFVPVELTDER
jgi:hypothetical protein